MAKTKREEREEKVLKYICPLIWSLVSYTIPRCLLSKKFSLYIQVRIFILNSFHETRKKCVCMHTLSHGSIRLNL